ncbi:TRAPP complex subunit trs33 [Mycena olivaceomarginata]|nr:TRAPP complex subunit trs33 [Mycena olivaceomarginata]
MASRSSATIVPSTSAGTLAPQNLVALADPPVRQIDAAVMDYFIIELVNTLRASAAVATERSKKIEAEMVEAGLIPAPPVLPPQPLKKDAPSARDSTTSLNSRASTGGRPSVADEAEEAVRTRLEAIGLHVGANFTERLCRDRPSFAKDIWVACWEKQEHQGIYVLQDNSGRADAIRRAKLTTVSPEITSLPQCTFQVKLPKGT